MPAVTRETLTRVLLQALNEGPATALPLSPSHSNPRRLLIHFPDSTIVAHAYIWTLTPGGRPSLPFEYRVQMTGVRSPLLLNDAGPTVLLGFEPSLQVFAGFDTESHRVFTTGSPSVQTDVRVVRRALTEGIALDRKSNGEIACGIRADRLADYVRQAASIHTAGKKAANYRLIDKAVRGVRLSETQLRSLSLPRRRIVGQIARWSRAAAFRKIVLQAYDHRCAVTGLSLNLVEAAHIVPVGVDGSSDDVGNGIALSPTYHRAYDQGLLYLEDDFAFHLNDRVVDDLVKTKRTAGLEEVRAAVQRPLVLPANRDLWPSAEFIRKANRIRLAR